MALSRRDVNLACGVAVLGWAVSAFWSPSVRLTPFAFLAGVLTCFVGIAYLLCTSSYASRRPRNESLPQPTFLGLTTSDRWSSELVAFEKSRRYQPVSVYEPSPAISQAVDGILNLARRDFIESWYSKISHGSAFNNEVDRCLRASFVIVLDRISQVDLVQIGVTKILPIVNAHVKSFNEAERLVRGKKLNLDVTETEELDVAIAARYRNGKLHPAASLAASKTTTLQQQHLRRLTGSLVADILPANMTSSSSVIILIRELLSCAILLPLLQLLADPDVLNQLIEAYGRSILNERKNVRKLRAALEEHTSPAPKKAASAALPRLSAQDSERTFEKFVRAIRQCSSLSDARRFRSEVSRQLRKDAVSANSDATYIRRLEIGKKMLDQKVAELSTTSSGKQNKAALTTSSESHATHKERASLREVLYDTSGLSYFMEFMDRLNLNTLVQFWIVVDGIRNPLDQYAESPLNSSSNARSSDSSDRQDLVQISDAYLWKPELNIPAESQSTVRSFLDAGENASERQLTQARQALLDAQSDVFEEMNAKHFPKFQKSDLFYKWVTSETPQFTSSPTNGSITPSEPEHFPHKGNSQSLLAQAKEGSLRRAVGSSPDLAKVARGSEDFSESRRSLDDSAPHTPLFGLDDEDPLSGSTQSLDSTDVFAGERADDKTEVIDAVQAALDDIIGGNPGRDSLFASLNQGHSDPHGSQDPFQLAREEEQNPISDKEKPSLASLGLLGASTSRSVFSEGDLFGENEKFWEEDGEGRKANRNQGADEDDIHEAAPGDLGLSEQVESMTVEIERLESQQEVLESLMRKAELTNNAAELRILRKSKTGLERELKHKELQRQQYIIQRSENELYGRASVSIKSIMVGTDLDGHEFAMYVIEVQRFAGENTPSVTWAIARRYSEFHELHRRLRAKHSSIRDLDFPRRQMVLTLQKDFLKKRRAALEKYLQELLMRQDVCRSIEFRAFLSQQAIRPTDESTGSETNKQDFITRIYNSVTDGMEEFVGNVPVIDQLSAAGQNLITAASMVSSNKQTDTATVPRSMPGGVAETAEAEAEAEAFDAKRDSQLVTFVKPICDIFLEVFQLNQGNNWLRGRAVVMVIQQLLGGTIERRVREVYKKFFASEEYILKYLDILKDTMWPDGKLRTAPPARSEAEKSRSKKEAGLVVATLLPDLTGNVVGRTNAGQAGRRVFAAIMNERLNQHLMYTLLDELVDAVFGIRVAK